MLLASCTLDDAKRYHGKLVFNGDTGKKKDDVMLNIVTDDPDDILKCFPSSAKCLTTRVRPSFCPKDLYGNVFHEVSLEEYSGVDEVEGVVCLVRLPDGFCDMRKVESIVANGEGYNDVEAKVRVIGGNLLEIPGIHIGRYDSGKEKLSSVFNGVYDIFEEVSLKDIDVTEILSKVKSKASKVVRGTGIKKVNKKQVAFSKLFDEGDVEF